ncbi:TetR/AcrR family transcriptional regulator [Thermodesulfobacteriota bacterium]
MEKRQRIIDAATRLFADQGFDGTTTLQITKEAGATEPLLYHHFKGKDELFAHILSNAFAEYFDRIETLPQNTNTQFEKIKNLIDFHFKFVKDMPDEIYLIINICPAKLNDPEHFCAKNVQRQRKWLITYLTNCLKKGIKSGEFIQVPITATVGLLIALFNGLLRQRSLQLESIKGLKTTAIEFCERSLVKKDR